MSNFTAEGTSKTVKIKQDNLNIHYHDAGSGDVLVLLHGGGPGASAWSNFKQNIDFFAEHFRVLMIDQPGFGKSDKPDHGQGLGAYNAGAVKGVLDELGIEKAHLIGNSMGGLVSAKFELDYPERTDRLILMGPAMGIGFAVPAPTEGQKVLGAFHRGDGPTKEKMQAVINVLMYDSSGLDNTLLEERFAAATEPDAAKWQSANMFSAKMKMEELWREAEKISHKTLLIWGRDDRVSPYERGLFLLQRIPDVRMHIFSRCGHWAMLEQTEEFNRVCLDFLTGA